MQQGAIPQLVRLLDGAHVAETLCQLREPLLVRLLCKAVVHIRPFIVLAFGSGKQIGGGLADMAKRLKPKPRVLLFVAGGLQEELGDLVIPLPLRNGGKVGIFIAGLASPAKAASRFFSVLVPA